MVKGRRRGVRLDRTGFGTAWWFLTSRAAVIVAIVAVLLVLAAAAAWTRPWQALIEERVVYVPVPAMVTDDPISDSPAASDGGGEAPRSAPAPDQAPERP